jgi:hypothetical protein
LVVVITSIQKTCGRATRGLTPPNDFDLANLILIVRAYAIARRTPKRTRDYPSPKPTLHRFFSHKPPFFFFNYRAIIEESDSDSEISNIPSLAILKDHKPNENWKTPVRATVRSLRW